MGNLTTSLIFGGEPIRRADSSGFGFRIGEVLLSVSLPSFSPFSLRADFGKHPAGEIPSAVSSRPLTSVQEHGYQQKGQQQHHQNYGVEAKEPAVFLRFVQVISELRTRKAKESSPEKLNAAASRTKPVIRDLALVYRGTPPTRSLLLDPSLPWPANRVWFSLIPASEIPGVTRGSKRFRNRVLSPFIIR